MVQRPAGVVEPLPLIVVRRGQTLVRQGETCTGLWIVESGVLRASIVTDDGRELTLDVLGRGDGAGEPAGLRATCTVRALRPSRVRPVTDDLAIELLAARGRRLAALASELAWLDVPDRIERKLEDIAIRFGHRRHDGFAIPFTLSQDDIASIVGTSRESVSRALSRSKDAGRIRVERRGRYIVRTQLRLVREI